MLSLQQMMLFCEQLKGTEETYPFGEENIVYKVGGKMYLLLDKLNPDRITIKCEPSYAQELRATYAAVTSGYHMNKKHWNTVFLDGTIPDTTILTWIEDSYHLVCKNISKKQQKPLKENE